MGEPRWPNDHLAPGHVHRATYGGDGCDECDEMFLTAERLRHLAKTKDVKVVIVAEQKLSPDHRFEDRRPLSMAAEIARAHERVIASDIILSITRKTLPGEEMVIFHNGKKRS